MVGVQPELKKRVALIRKIIGAIPLVLLVVLTSCHDNAPLSGSFIDYLQGEYAAQSDRFTGILRAMHDVATAWPNANLILQFERLGAILAIAYAGRAILIGYALLYAAAIVFDDWLSRDIEAGRILAATTPAEPPLSNAVRARKYGCITLIFVTFALFYAWIASPDACLVDQHLAFSCPATIVTLVAVCVFMQFAIGFTWASFRSRFHSLSDRGKIWKIFD